MSSESMAFSFRLKLDEGEEEKVIDFLEELDEKEEEWIKQALLAQFSAPIEPTADNEPEENTDHSRPESSEEHSLGIEGLVSGLDEDEDSRALYELLSGLAPQEIEKYFIDAAKMRSVLEKNAPAFFLDRSKQVPTFQQESSEHAAEEAKYDQEAPVQESVGEPSIMKQLSEALPAFLDVSHFTEEEEHVVLDNQ